MRGSRVVAWRPLCEVTSPTAGAMPARRARARDVVWRGISENGLQVSNGVYLYRIIDAAGAEVDHGKIAIVR